MKQTLKTLALFTALSLAASLASAATAFTDPVGAMSFTIRGNSDTYVAVPFAKAADFQGTLSGAPTGSGATRTLSIAGTPPTFTLDQFKDLWYVKFSSGPLAGRYYTVSSNSATQITIDINGDTTVDSAVSGNSFKVVKFWTLGEMFPSGQTTITPSADNFEANPSSAILVPNFAGSGVDLAAGAAYFPCVSYDGGGYGWADTSDPFTPADTIRLAPDGFFVVRRTIAGDTTYVSSGSVDATNTVYSAFASETQSEDNFIGLARPKDVQLQDFLLNNFVNSSDSFSTDGDILLYFDNGVGSVGIDRPATQAFIRDVLGDWYDTSDPFTIVSTNFIPAGSGLILRKNIVGAGLGGTKFVTNVANY